MITVGIDVGSLTAKAVVFQDNNVMSWVIKPAGWQPRTVGEEVYSEALEKAGFTKKDVAYVVATGYGRNVFPLANQRITEITCHAKGATYFLPETRTIIDIGGQDSKVICLNDEGDVIDFAMNDKCAAGTGRFLEVIAGALGIGVESMGELSRNARPAIISSMCTVFAESEVISLLNEGVNREAILSGVHQSIAKRVSTFVRQLSIRKEITFCGGVAKNCGVNRALEEELNSSILSPPEPQITGAVGAAIIAYEQITNKANETGRRKTSSGDVG